MLTFDSTTRSELDGAISLTDWIARLNTALGNVRRIRCFRDSNANAADPVLTGVEFRNVGSTGPMSQKAGAIVDLGVIEGTTISEAADMTTGKSVALIMGNGRWMRMTLGLTRAAQAAKGIPTAQQRDYDLQVFANFTSVNGFGVTANLAIRGKKFMASGNGDPVPALTASAPKRIEVWNWQNTASPVLVGFHEITKRDEDWVYEDPEMADEVGDVGIYQSETGTLYGNIEFGTTLFVSSKNNREDYATATEPLYEVLTAASVRGTWTTYPQVDTFNAAEHVTFPEAFKVVIKNAAGDVLYTHQMHDGSPMNLTKMLHQTRDATKAMQPNWNTGMQLPWRNARPRISSRANKWYPGMIDAGLRASRAKVNYTSIGAEPLWTNGQGSNAQNGMQNLYGLPRWPLPNQNYNPSVVDPYLDDFNSKWPPYAVSAVGWDYEPGSNSGHNWYTGPGGPRFDRAPIPSIIALILTDNNWTRLQDNTSGKDMFYAWCNAYHNHSNHWTSNPNTLEFGANNDDLLDNWGTVQNFYGDSWAYGPKVIDLRASMREGINGTHVDKDGRLFWSGWGRDNLHGYGCAGWGALACNSPMLAATNKWDTWFMMQALHGGRQWFHGSYMVRDQAWLWMHYCIGWKLATTHRLGFTKEQLASRFSQHCDQLHAEIYVPTYVTNSTEGYYNALRALGQPFKYETGIETQGGALGMYMAGVLALMKQTGFWSALYHRATKNALVMKMQIDFMDKYCFDLTLDSSMKSWPSIWPGTETPGGWGDHMPPEGLMDAFHDAAGNVIGDREVSVHPFSMYPYIRRDYFPEFTHPRLAATITKWDSMLGAVTTRVNAQANPADKRSVDHYYGYPGVVPWKAPTELGPA